MLKIITQHYFDFYGWLKSNCVSYYLLVFENLETWKFILKIMHLLKLNHKKENENSCNYLP